MAHVTSPVVLSIDRLSAGYGARRVLHELTLPSIEPGGITVLVGPNGAGKSTLLRVLAGLLPAQGTVRLGGRDLLGLTIDARADEIGFMPSALPQRVALTVLEATMAALCATPWTGQGLPATHRAIGVLERVGILDLAHEPLDQLSSGQRQLASLAQSLMRDPIMLLLDEPTSALDLRHQLLVFDLVRQFAESGRIVVTVLHDLSLAARWASQIVVLDHGTVRAAGTPEMALTPDLLAHVYGVTARIEPCTHGRLQVLVDSVAPRPEDRHDRAH
jgi:iron complex transport system ATP-binding protein